MGVSHKGVITHEADVLVIGGGLAGCFAAIKAKEYGAAKVIQVDKGQVGKSGCSAFGAGAFDAWDPQEDSLDEVFKKVIEQADYMPDQERVQDHLTEVGERVKEMESYGVPFERDAEGKLARAVGRGNIKRYMFHGPGMMDAMRKASLKRGVEQIKKTMVTDLLTKDNKVVGAVGFNILSGDFHVFKAKATVMAAGHTRFKGRMPGHRDCTGDGWVAALRAGATLSNMEQAARNLIPAQYDIGPGMDMLAGSGLIFYNAKGERFMPLYQPDMKERAPMTILSYCLGLEARAGNAPIYADMTHFTPEVVQRLKRVLPLPMKMYERVRIAVGDKFVKRVEWMTTPPICRGGIVVNPRMESKLAGLYACGDAVPWAGELLGQAQLAGATTSGATAGKFAARYAAGADAVKVDQEQVEELKKYSYGPLERKDGIEPDQILLSLQEIMVPFNVLLIREEDRMQKALEQVKELRDNQVPLLFAYDPHYLRMALEVRNMVLVAEMELRSALLRTESRWRAIREDHAYTDNINWLKWIMVKLEEGKMRVWAEDIPIDRYRYNPKKEKLLNACWQAAERRGIAKIDKEGVLWA